MCRLYVQVTGEVRHVPTGHDFERHDLNWKSPECVANAVLHRASGDKDTCQYPLARSRVENHRLPANISKVSSIRGRGYASLTEVQPAVVHTEPSSTVLLRH